MERGRALKIATAVVGPGLAVWAGIACASDAKKDKTLPFFGSGTVATGKTENPGTIAVGQTENPSPVTTELPHGVGTQEAIQNGLKFPIIATNINLGSDISKLTISDTFKPDPAKNGSYSAFFFESVNDFKPIAQSLRLAATLETDESKNYQKILEITTGAGKQMADFYCAPRETRIVGQFMALAYDQVYATIAYNKVKNYEKQGLLPADSWPKYASGFNPNCEIIPSDMNDLKMQAGASVISTEAPKVETPVSVTSQAQSTGEVLGVTKSRKIGETVGDFTIGNSAGEHLNYQKDLAGRAVIIFYCCLGITHDNDVAKIESLKAKYDNTNLVIINVVLTNKNSMLTAPIINEETGAGSSFSGFGGQGFPYLVAIDKNGVWVDKRLGANKVSAGIEDLAQKLAAGEKFVPTATSLPSSGGSGIGGEN